tara:strand:- start:1689 stop:2168 length:480 start_codon:yes stop_codon:yes gene_type:complete
MSRFESQYELGKQSEIDSLPDLNKLFKTTLKMNDDDLAPFDYYNDKIEVELKTRPKTRYSNGILKHTTLKGDEIELKSLYFDSIKMSSAFQYNKKNPNNKKDFFIVWKCKNKYLHWKINWDKHDYYLEDQFRDVGFGYNQHRDVINVKKEAIIPLYEFW